MLSQTLAAGQAKRLDLITLNLGLVQLGEHTGMSSGVLIEDRAGTALPDASDAAQELLML